MNSETNANQTQPKKKKPKGPFRWEAILPILIIIALTGTYFSLFFDRHLKHLIEWTGTYIHGAEVNVDRISTRFLRGTFHLTHLQITDKNNPQKNALSIGEIKWGFLWDALLRAKLVITEASVLNIQLDSPRKYPGKINPPPPKNTQKSEALAHLEKGLLEQTQKEFDGNVFGDIAQFAGGVSPADQLKSLENELKSEVRIKELETEFKQKQKQWETRLQSLPKGPELKALETRIKEIKIDTHDPIKFADSIKQIQSLVKEVDQKLKNVSETGTSLNQDIKVFQESLKGLDQIMKEDLAALEQRLKIPKMDLADFSKKLFGRMFAEKLVYIQKYWALAQEYMPAKKTTSEAANKEKENEPLVPHSRGSGKNYHFPISTGYPVFWLKKAAISSEPGPEGKYGALSGELKDLTSHPSQISFPTTLTLKGDFPQQEVFGFKAYLEMDHRTETPKDSLDAQIKSYPTSPWSLAHSNDITFAINKSQGESHLKAVYTQGEIKITLNNIFKNIQYEVKSNSQIIEEVLSQAIKSIPSISLEAQALGPWDHLKLNIRSNLGDELAQSFQKQIQNKINEVRNKIKTLVEEKVGKEKQKFLAEFDRAKNQMTQEIDKLNQEMDKTKKIAEEKVSGNKNSQGAAAKEKLQETGKKALDALKKKLSF